MVAYNGKVSRFLDIIEVSRFQDITLIPRCLNCFIADVVMSGNARTNYVVVIILFASALRIASAFHFI